eukprot:c8530_g1_i1.p1 GENE.c8530_g1_i1~~c8530_g1_i1.p1  ORF type:complete len:301 (+),score=26.50 c8530_g1_i1:238-1140(+)
MAYGSYALSSTYKAQSSSLHYSFLIPSTSSAFVAYEPAHEGNPGEHADHQPESPNDDHASVDRSSSRKIRHGYKSDRRKSKTRADTSWYSTRESSSYEHERSRSRSRERSRKPSKKAVAPSARRRRLPERRENLEYKWSTEEDEQLRQWVATNGSRGWRLCGEKLGRSSNACALRWLRVLDPSNWGKDWTAEEDEILTRAQLGGLSYIKIAKMLKDRSASNIRCRWKELARQRFVSGIADAGGPAGVARDHQAPWEPSEDAVLAAWVAAHGTSMWNGCAAQLTGRTPDQCRLRWARYARS